MKNMRKSVCIIFLMIGISLSAQNVAVKTNLLYDATATFNLGAEIGLSPRWTLDLSSNYNPFSFSDNKKWKHWMAQPEARYWFCERFNGHFMGLHLLGGQYNVGGVKLPFGIYPSVEDYRYEGYYYGAGLAYGYQWVLRGKPGPGLRACALRPLRLPTLWRMERQGRQELSGSDESRHLPYLCNQVNRRRTWK